MIGGGEGWVWMAEKKLEVETILMLELEEMEVVKEEREVAHIGS